ncbi:AlpA family transcriptional regulator [Parafrankia sp. BMG5.11]|uniref:helix-turn-helix transcriptional regulator n=1 Tax=Parafrankia sp. BMG5.11 TaxID=222540 RepID=UPI001FB2AB90|nr:DNA-binding protein [Parafrankia sp. BMG5.11]
MGQPLMGAAEIAQRLGVGRTRVNQLLKEDPTFPKPHATLAAGHIWQTDDVEAWIAEHRPDLPPPAKR